MGEVPVIPAAHSLFDTHAFEGNFLLFVAKRRALGFPVKHSLLVAVIW
jgi:hypothetical protein